MKRPHFGYMRVNCNRCSSSLRLFPERRSKSRAKKGGSKTQKKVKRSIKRKGLRRNEESRLTWIGDQVFRKFFKGRRCAFQRDLLNETRDEKEERIAVWIVWSYKVVDSKGGKTKVENKVEGGK